MIALLDARAFELGFAPTAAAMFSLGPQNTMLLRQGLAGRRALIVIGTCYGVDLGLVLVGSMGLGAVAMMLPLIPLLMRGVGMGYLAVMSARSLALAVRGGYAGSDERSECAQPAFVAALMVSLLNPLAWVESVLVLGAMSSTVRSDLLTVFAAGAALGSLCRLAALGLGARMLAPLFRSTVFRQAFDVTAAMAMAGMAVMLGTQLIF